MDSCCPLLPWVEHMPIAKLALKHKKNFCTTSYISDEMRDLDEAFKAAGIVSFNECGTGDCWLELKLPGRSKIFGQA